MRGRREHVRHVKAPGASLLGTPAPASAETPALKEVHRRLPSIPNMHTSGAEGCGVQASHRGGFSYCRVQALECEGFSSCGMWVMENNAGI